ncbi:MAG: hypothetical protein DI598_03215 [Pseudopedobacter saltans]|uniref:DUF4468 domain-containing protein n=1 Tax=Pseudopedobacter saltans TaxID=151895 RepID=A0A2W5F5Q4_9SPHI|nr:MAG: hypothetical protein DI598_03215 [Pseudopedobacter saltans]
MKKILLFSIALSPLLSIAQKKLVSVPKGIYPLNNSDSLFCYYFPVKENIANPQQPFYKAHPSLEDILHVASTMPCDSFVVKRDGKSILTINLKKDSTWRFTVKDRITNVDTTFNTELMGVMTEHRSIELINNGYDKKAGQVFGTFNFNNQKISYITTKNLENAVMKAVDYFLYVKKQN